MINISDLKIIDEMFNSKLPAKSEILLAFAPDAISIICPAHFIQVNNHEFLTKAEFEMIKFQNPGFHFDDVRGCWAIFN